MPREDAAEKPARLLASRRLTITRVDGATVEAVCEGDSGIVRRLGHHPDHGWWCLCPAWVYRRRCSHLWALMSVTKPK